MQRLIEGIHRFHREEFGRYRELFQRLSRDGQKPHTLFITCSDSRVVAELVTRSRPGDLFVVKNVGNIVPQGGDSGRGGATAAGVEFAVGTLGVSDIVVCGHSECGAMQALLEGLPDPGATPHLSAWLGLAGPVLRVIESDYRHLTDRGARITAAAEENVLFALENLRTYPAVRAGLEAGSLRLHGWFFKIATAEFFAFDPEQRQFVPLTGAAPGATP